MITDKAAHEIQTMKGTITLKFIHEFDEQWDAAVKRIKNSKKRLWNMPIVCEKSYKV